MVWTQIGVIDYIYNVIHKHFCNYNYLHSKFGLLNLHIYPLMDYNYECGLCFQWKKINFNFQWLDLMKNIVCHKILESINFRFEKKKKMHSNVKYLRKFIIILKNQELEKKKFLKKYVCIINMKNGIESMISFSKL